MVSSGTNFALGLYLVRVLTPADYGLYGIGFAVSLFYAGIGNALFLTQMVVHTPDKAPEDRIRYAGRMLVLVTTFCAATLTLAGLVFYAGGMLWPPVVNHAGFGLAVTAASIAFLMKDFFVRYAYNTRNEIGALAMNLVLGGSLLFSLMALHHW